MLTLGSVFMANSAFAYHLEYTKTKNSRGERIIRAEIVHEGNVVATGHSGTEGTREEQKEEAAQEALDDLGLDNNCE